MKKSLTVLNEANFSSEVLSASVPVVVEFGATWCGPCRALEPILEGLATKWDTSRKVGTINTDEAPALANRYAVRGTPTLLVFANGKEIARHVGLTSAAKIEALIDKAITP
ncbi:MAG: thioredoxin domain-containing protein [Polyangiaceae bacterium]